MSAPRRLGLRPEKRHSGAYLTMRPRLWVAVRWVLIRVGPKRTQAPVANPCLGRSKRLHAVFRTHSAGCPHRVADLTWTRHTATADRHRARRADQAAGMHARERPCAARGRSK